MKLSVDEKSTDESVAEVNRSSATDFSGNQHYTELLPVSCFTTCTPPLSWPWTLNGAAASLQVFSSVCSLLLALYGTQQPGCGTCSCLVQICRQISETNSSLRCSDAALAAVNGSWASAAGSRTPPLRIRGYRVFRPSGRVRPS